MIENRASQRRWQSQSLSRRRFLAGVATLAGTLAVPPVVRSADGAGKYRVAVIGHAGRGDYGHGLETIFANRPDIELVALADPDAARAGNECYAAEFVLEGHQQFLRHPGRAEQPAALAAIFDLDLRQIGHGTMLMAAQVLHKRRGGAGLPVNTLKRRTSRATGLRSLRW